MLAPARRLRSLALMDPPRYRRPRMNRGCTIVLTVLAALILVAFFWWYSAQQMPIVSIPTPIYPNPNAFDTLNAAAGQQLDSGKIGYAVSATHTGVKDDREYSWAEKEKFVAENGPALALL